LQKTNLLKTFFRVILESIRFAVTELKLNRTRTFLTLLGISIGIFCIISVFSVVDSMKKTIQTSIESLGSNVLYVQKWPWEFSADFAWWKYMKRPVPSLDEFKEIKQRSKTAENVVFIASTMRPVEYNEIKTDETVIMGISEDYPVVQPVDIAKGRFFTASEHSNGANVAVIGFSIADLLFPSLDPVGQSVKVLNQKVKIVGVLAYEGETGFSNSHDRSVLLPVQFYRRYIDMNDDRSANTLIMVRVKQGISNIQAVDELTGIIRSVRRLKPTAEDNFSINESSLLTKGFESLFSILSLAGWFIGSFSLLVGGFGIANIMFVSVTERTRIIGVQKALGAKNQFILFQYLIESVFLSIMGGAIGLIIVALLTFAVSSASEFSLFVSFGNILTALLISAFIGIISGLAPAFKASRLDPVEAIRR
jgi:putative ABC transport system permease protein